MTWVIKTKPGCAFCDKAKELLYRNAENRVIEQKHETLPEIAAFKQQGFTTFPQIWESGQYIGGYNELAIYLADKDYF